MQNALTSLFTRGTQTASEMIGSIRRVMFKLRNVYTVYPTVDVGTVDYRFYDRARRGVARNLEIAGALLKPLNSKLASWILGRRPTLRIEHAYTQKTIGAWFEKWFPKVLTAIEESLALGDSYIIAYIEDETIKLSIVPPDSVTPLVDPQDFSRIVGWRVTQTYQHPTEQLSTQTIIDDYTPTLRTRTILQGGATVSIQRFTNLLSRVPVIHIANNKGTDEVFGRPEAEALVQSPNSVLHRYNEVLDAGITGNVRAGRPLLAVEKMGDAAAVDAFWDRYSTLETTEMPDGTTESVEVIDIDSDQVITLPGNAEINFKSPASSSGDASRYLEILFYLFVQHTEIPEFILGTAITGSKASAEEQMPPFVRFIEKRQGYAEEWMYELIAVVRELFSLFDPKIDLIAPLRIVWETLTTKDGRLTLDTINWAFSNGLMDEETAVILMPVDVEDPRAMLKQARKEREERDLKFAQQQADLQAAAQNSAAQEANTVDNPQDTQGNNADNTQDTAQNDQQSAA